MNHKQLPALPVLANGLALGEHGAYYFLTHAMVVTTPTRDVVAHELGHAYTVLHYDTPGNSFEISRELTGISHGLLRLILAFMATYGGGVMALSGEGQYILRRLKAPRSIKRLISILLSRLSYVELILDATWRRLEPVAELAAVDLVTRLEDQGRTSIKWRGAAIEVKWRSYSEQQISALGRKYGVELLKAWQALRRIRDEEVRDAVLALGTALVYMGRPVDGQDYPDAGDILEDTRFRTTVHASSTKIVVLDPLSRIQQVVQTIDALKMDKGEALQMLASLRLQTEASALALLRFVNKQTLGDLSPEFMGPVQRAQRLTSGLGKLLKAGRRSFDEAWGRSLFYTVEGGRIGYNVIRPERMPDVYKPLMTFAKTNGLHTVRVNHWFLEQAKQVSPVGLGELGPDWWRELFFSEHARSLIKNAMKPLKSTTCPFYGWTVCSEMEEFHCDDACFIRKALQGVPGC